jgi:transposase InsO family protein
MRSWLGNKNAPSNGTTLRRKPMQNGFVESFNGRLRDECLNEYLFANLAQQIIEEWKIDYNTNPTAHEP